MSFKFFFIALFSLWIVFVSDCEAQEPSHKAYPTQLADTGYILQTLKNADTLTNHDSAISLCKYTLALSEKVGFRKGVWKSYNELGKQYMEMGNSIIALQYLKYALVEINKNPASNNEKGRVFMDIGNAFCIDGSYDSAVAYFHKSIESIKQYPGKLSLAVPYANLGRVLGLLKSYRQGLHYLNNALSIADKEQDYDYLAAVYQNIAVVYGKMDSIGSSRKNFHLSLSLSRKHNLKIWEKKSLANLGALAEMQGDADSAIWYYEAALATGIKDLGQDISMMGNIGYHYYLKKNYAKADRILNEALAISQPSFKSVGVRLYLLLAKVAKARGLFSMASQYYEQYIGLYDSIQGISMADKVNGLQAKYDATQKDNELIKRELLLTRRQSILQKRNTIAYAIAAGILMIGCFGLLYYRYRRRIELRAEKQRLEIAAWKASLEGEEKERRRLAHELHDNIGGNLSTLKMWLENIRKEQHFPTAKQQSDFKDVTLLLNNTLTEVRNTAHHLMPELLLRFGLTEAVRIFCLNVQKASGIEIQFHYFGYIGQLGKERELIIYRSIQELVQNIVKHAEATTALVQLSLHETTLTITVEDNGKGIDLTTLSQNKGIGLQSARNSIEKSGGQFSISSEPGNGTTIDIEMKIDLHTYNSQTNQS